jgi:hypothetical protein
VPGRTRRAAASTAQRPAPARARQRPARTTQRRDGARPRALWDVLLDWAKRPFAHETTLTGTQLGLATRGAGSIVAAKLVAICIGGITLVGGGIYCLQTPLGLNSPAHLQHVSRPHHTATPAKRHRAEPPDRAQAKWINARATPSPSPAPKPVRRPKAKSSTDPAAHERQGAVSPAPPDAAPNGQSEFGPVSTQGSNRPAAAVNSGGPEFP